MVLIAIGIKRLVTAPLTGGQRPLPSPLTVTPPVAAGPDDLFEDVTEKAGIKFVHQFCDSRIANILESNGAGGCWLDYDGDGLMDLFLVTVCLDGVTHPRRARRAGPTALIAIGPMAPLRTLQKRRAWPGWAIAPRPSPRIMTMTVIRTCLSWE